MEQLPRFSIGEVGGHLVMAAMWNFAEIQTIHLGCGMTCQAIIREALSVNMIQSHNARQDGSTFGTLKHVTSHQKLKKGGQML